MARKSKSEVILTNEEKISKGVASESLLKSPVFLEVFDKLEDQFVSQWMSSQDDDTSKRERLFLSLKVLSEIRTRLESNVTSKILAERETR